ncbi:unnamed protein product, partial [Prorocentrum cordatum]
SFGILCSCGTQSPLEPFLSLGTVCPGPFQALHFSSTVEVRIVLSHPCCIALGSLVIAFFIREDMFISSLLLPHFCHRTLQGLNNFVTSDIKMVAPGWLSRPSIAPGGFPWYSLGQVFQPFFCHCVCVLRRRCLGLGVRRFQFIAHPARRCVTALRGSASQARRPSLQVQAAMQGDCDLNGLDPAAAAEAQKLDLIRQGFRINWMNMRDAATGRVLWENHDWPVECLETEAQVPREVLQCRQ